MWLRDFLYNTVENGTREPSECCAGLTENVLEAFEHSGSGMLTCRSHRFVGARLSHRVINESRGYNQRKVASETWKSLEHQVLSKPTNLPFVVDIGGSTSWSYTCIALYHIENA